MRLIKKKILDVDMRLIKKKILGVGVGLISPNDVKTTKKTRSSFPWNCNNGQTRSPLGTIQKDITNGTLIT